MVLLIGVALGVTAAVSVVRVGGWSRANWVLWEDSNKSWFDGSFEHDVSPAGAYRTARACQAALTALVDRAEVDARESQQFTQQFGGALQLLDFQRWREPLTGSDELSTVTTEETDKGKLYSNNSVRYLCLPEAVDPRSRNIADGRRP